jgi:hypothetical protein
MSKFDRDVDRLKERLQDRHERKLGRLYREKIKAERRAEVGEGITQIAFPIIVTALFLWWLL